VIGVRWEAFVSEVINVRMKHEISRDFHCLLRVIDGALACNLKRIEVTMAKALN
jgi:hypothetical protein